MLKIDLHTHSILSPDGGITLKEYEKTISNGVLDFIAITDHNTINFALEANSKLGNKIIVGEEIETNCGEIIGLFLNKNIKPNQGILATIKQIKAQGGIVYIPHPFETVRSGISKSEITNIIELIDILETQNGRAFFGDRTKQAVIFAKQHKIPAAVSSDSHRNKGLGKTYSLIEKEPTAKNIVKLLKNAEYTYRKPSVADLLHPKLNRIKKIFK